MELRPEPAAEGQGLHAPPDPRPPPPVSMAAESTRYSSDWTRGPRTISSKAPPAGPPGSPLQPKRRGDFGALKRGFWDRWLGAVTAHRCGFTPFRWGHPTTPPAGTLSPWQLAAPSNDISPADVARDNFPPVRPGVDFLSPSAGTAPSITRPFWKAIFTITAASSNSLASDRRPRASFITGPTETHHRLLRRPGPQRPT